MKLTNAYGGAVKPKTIKTDTKALKSGSGKSSAVKTDKVLAGSKDFETKTNDIMRKIKYYQTEISFAQKGKAALARLEAKLDELRDITSELGDGTPSLNFRSKADKIMIEIEQIAKGLEDNYQTALAGLNLETLGLDKYWVAENKLELVDEAIDDIIARDAELDENIEKYNVELSKLQVASENTAAAGSKINDTEELNKTVTDIKAQINDPQALDAQANLSQSRVMNILGEE